MISNKGCRCLLLAVALSGGCGGNGDSAGRQHLPANTVNDPAIRPPESGYQPMVESSIETTQFETSKVQLDYPSSWIVKTPFVLVTQFESPEYNYVTGYDSCVLTNDDAPNASLIGVVDEYIERSLLESPEPTIEMLEVNGRPVARVAGYASLFPLPLQAQLIYADSVFTALQCFGNESDDEIISIMNSMVVL